MEQQNLPLDCGNVYTVRYLMKVEGTIMAMSAKDAEKLLRDGLGPQLTHLLDIVPINTPTPWRENSKEDFRKPPTRPKPRGTPTPGGAAPAVRAA